MKLSPRNFQRATLGLLMVLIATVVWVGYSFSPAEEDKDMSYRRYFNENYKIFSLSTPRSLTFAGEEVPLELIDVRESLDRELLVNTYWQSQSLLFNKRANRWFPVIEPILAENGIPDDFKYLALIESGFENVVSPAGATGFWQFLRDTGREYGLEINNEVDERYHVEKSTEAACKYLKDAYDRFGSWTLAAASYNMGMRGLQRQIERQNSHTYYDLLLNSETARYVYRIMAVKEIMSKPGQYGFHYRPQDLYPPYHTKEVEVDTAVEDFARFALEHGVNYKILKILNPWLRDTYLTNPEGNTYRIKLPADSTAGLTPYFIHPDQMENFGVRIKDTLN